MSGCRDTPQVEIGCDRVQRFSDKDSLRQLADDCGLLLIDGLVGGVAIAEATVRTPSLCRLLPGPPYAFALLL